MIPSQFDKLIEVTFFILFADHIEIVISDEAGWFADKNSCRSLCKILMTLKSILELVSDPRILNSDRILKKLQFFEILVEFTKNFTDIYFSDKNSDHRS